MMASKDLSPPQTYSRLFRPWDSTKTSAENKNPKRFDSNQQVALENVLKTVQGRSTQFAYDPSQFPYEIDVNHVNILGLPTVSNSIPSDLYYGTNGVPPSSFGLDPITISLMEQEYARVMAEDAHIKALNAKKQRPKKFKCPHCDVAFSNNGQLKGHIRIHTGERPFQCDNETCGKTFTRNEELTRHKRIHSGLRPFSCSTCGKKFGRRDHLKKHMKTHMPQERQLGPIFVPMYPYLYGY